MIIFLTSLVCNFCSHISTSNTFYNKLITQEKILPVQNISSSVESQEKAYKYTITEALGFYKVIGYDTSNNPITLSSKAQSISQAINIIEEDRLSGTHYEDVEIYLDNLNLINVSINCVNGSYTFQGACTFTNLSTIPCFIVENSCRVVFNNANINNLSFSNTIDANENSTIVIKKGVYKAKESVINYSYNANIYIEDANIISSNKSAIIGGNSFSSSSTLTIVATEENSCNISTNSINYALNLINTNIEINNAKISAINAQYAIKCDNSPLTLLNNCKILSIKNAIHTNNIIYASNDTYEYSGQLLYIDYYGTYQNNEINLILKVTDNNKNLFDTTNTAFGLRIYDSTIKISKYFYVKYLPNCNDNTVISSIPIDNNKYFAGDVVTIQNLPHDIREHYNFLGYSFNLNGTNIISTSTITIQNKNINLYAIWSSKIYSITYISPEGTVNNNATTYTYQSGLHLNQPKLSYHTFTGFLIDGETQTLNNLTLPYKNYTDIVIVLNFQLTDYNINYVGLSSHDINILNLQTTYNISSEPLNLSQLNFLLQGNSFYGVYWEEEYINEATQTLSFDPHNQNNAPFTLGTDITLYINTMPYHNSLGIGTLDNPYIIDSSDQFLAFLTGKKVETTQMTYISLGNNITLHKQKLTNFEVLKNFIFNGNNFNIYVNEFLEYSSNNGTSIYNSIFPIINNCFISNLNIDNYQANEIEVSLNNQNTFSSLCYSSENSVLQNINISTNIKLHLNNATLSDFYCGAFTAFSYGTIIENCTYLGNINFFLAGNIEQCQFYINPFAAHFYGSVIVNCISNGNILLDCKNISSCIESAAYLSNFASMQKNSLLSNSISYGNIVVQNNTNLPYIACGLALVLGNSNIIENNLCIPSLYLIKTSAPSHIVVGCLVLHPQNQLLNNAFIQIDNFSYIQLIDDIYNEPTFKLFTQEQISNYDFVGYLNSNRTNTQINLLTTCQLNNIDTSVMENLVVNTFYKQVNSNNNLFNKTICINIKSMYNQDDIKTIVVDDQNLPSYIIYPTYENVLFDKITLDTQGKQIFHSFDELDLSNTDEVNLYIHYISYSNYILDKSTPIIIITVLIILLLITFIIFCELPKAINLYYCNKQIYSVKLRAGTTLVVPNEYSKYTWFLDSGANKKLCNNKLPFIFTHINLYAFDEQTLDVINKIEIEKIKAEKVLKEKVNQLKIEKKILKEKQKHEKMEENNRKISNKQRIREEIESSGITIVKKEVKTIDENALLESTKQKKK